MKVELNIDSTTLGPTVQDVFNQLTPEQKQQLALEVMRGFLTEPHGAERIAYEQKLFDGWRRTGARLRAQWGYANPHGDIDAAAASDDTLRHTDAYVEQMKGFTSTRSVLVAEITKAAIATYRESAEALVKADPQLQAVLAQVLDEVRKDFPKYVHDAMIAWFCSNLTRMGEGIGQALMQSSQAAQLSDDVLRRLDHR